RPSLMIMVLIMGFGLILSTCKGGGMPRRGINENELLWNAGDIDDVDDGSGQNIAYTERFVDADLTQLTPDDSPNQVGDRRGKPQVEVETLSAKQSIGHSVLVDANDLFFTLVDVRIPDGQANIISCVIAPPDVQVQPETNGLDLVGRLQFGSGATQADAVFDIHKGVIVNVPATSLRLSVASLTAQNGTGLAAGESIRIQGFVSAFPQNRGPERVKRTFLTLGTNIGAFTPQVVVPRFATSVVVYPSNPTQPY